MANELATAYIALVPSLKGAKGTIERELGGIDTTSAGQQMGDKASSGFAGGFNIKGAAVAAAAVAGAAAAAKLVGTMTDSLWAYADYEQLVGGVETLFKESSDKLQEYAANAYKTAGMSANQYMEMSTSFAASLIQSLDGDTAKAADYANQAISDMSDNANKMGSDMQSIQNAYQGFAKQNYTMLDNLKLGYGGTKEEMARLLADATAISGIEYDMSSYADVVDAIHVIQTEMGITGTTAAEASLTISGSIASAQAAWTNWMTGLGNENANMEELTNQLVDTVATAAGNIIPRIGQIMTGLGSTLAEQLPIIINDLTTYITENSGQMADAALNFLGQMIPALASVGVALVANAAIMVNELLGSLAERAADFLAAGAEMISGVILGFKDGTIKFFDAIKEVCAGAINAVKEFFGIHSPSRVMRDMFGYVGEGMALGLHDSESTVNKAMGDLIGGAYDVAAGFNPSLSASMTPYGFAGGSNINVYIEGRSLADINAIDQFVEMVEMQARLNPAGI